MPRTPLRRLSAALLVVLAFAVAVGAQTRPPIQPEDYGQWESLGGAQFSPDGKWLTYTIGRINGESELRIRSLSIDSTRVVPYGSRPAFSPDSKWLAYSIGYSEDERTKLEKAKKPVQNKLGLLELGTGKETVLEAIGSFSFPERGSWLLMRGYAPQGSKAKGVDLILRDLVTGRDTQFGNIAESAWQDEGSLLAMLVDTERKSGNGVLLYDPATGVLRTLDSSTSSYKGLSWKEKDDDLAVLRTREDEGYEDPTHDVLAWRNLTGRRSEAKTFDHAKVASFPADMRIVDFRSLEWSDDAAMLFFGIKAWEKKPEKPKRAEKDTTSAGGKREEADEPPGVEIWHARDVDIMPEQKVQAQRERQRNFLAVWHLDADRFVQLGNDLTEDVTLVKGQKKAIGTDGTPYDPDRMFGPAYEDVYLIDTATGQSTRFKEKLEYGYGPSPAGKYFLYLENDHYWVYDLAKGTHTNITKDVPTVFVDLKDDHTVTQKPPFRYAGWSKDDASILLYDEYDIWEVRPDGSKATNLTGAAAERIVNRYTRLDFEERFIDTSKPIYLSQYGEWTKKWGYARLRIGRPIERLVFLDKNVGRLVKSKNTEVYGYTVQDFDDSPDLFVGGPNLADARQVTATNPFQSDYAWGHSQLIDFKNRAGQDLQGALFYPANYEPGKKYPMIVYIYEITSNTVHNYSTPSERSPYNPAVFTANGYFVLQCDIVYRDRNPGLSAVDCVVPAVEKVLATGMVDRARIGLVGHSWGAYQTSFIVTQTDLFSAAVAGAPLTDLISMYLSIYWNSGGTDARIFEISQGRMEVPPWQALDEYMANSALFNITKLDTPLLVAFGDKDGAVDWHQGVELYNAARREGKPYVMLVYAGENHSLRLKQNQLDYHRRIQAWFGHYLKGDEAPKWISEGLSFLEQEKLLKKETGTPTGGPPPGGRPPGR
jgi:dipeptidyl aminopeptidase/acylaminoacyl peptidase